jgi:hypothetical protein
MLNLVVRKVTASLYKVNINILLYYAARTDGRGS